MYMSPIFFLLFWTLGVAPREGMTLMPLPQYVLSFYPWLLNDNERTGTTRRKAPLCLRSSVSVSSTFLSPFWRKIRLLLKIVASRARPPLLPSTAISASDRTSVATRQPDARRVMQAARHSYLNRMVPLCDGQI